MKGDRVEIVIDAGGGTKTYEVTATRAGRRVEVVNRRGVFEVTEVTRSGVVVRTARFMASRVLALVEYPAPRRPEPYRRLVADSTFNAIERLVAIAAGRGTSLAGLALAWLLDDDRVTQVVIGPGRPEHLAPVAEALEHPLASEERAAIEEVLG